MIAHRSFKPLVTLMFALCAGHIPALAAGSNSHEMVAFNLGGGRNTSGTIDDAMRFNQEAMRLDRSARYAEAEKLYLQALDIVERISGPESAGAATLVNNLANLYRTTGRYGEAETHFRRAITTMEKIHGRDHPKVATFINNLAVLYNALGRYAEAEQLIRRTITIGERQLGASHPDVATWVNNLGITLQHLGKLDEAAKAYERALAMRSSATGRNNQENALTIGNLGAVYKELGRYREAEDLYTKALALHEAQYGPNHPNVGDVVTYLASLYSLQGNKAKAEPLFRRALEIDTQAFGNDHASVATKQSNLAETLADMGHFGEAEELFRRALATKESKLGRDHPEVAEVLNNYAGLLHATGRYTEAEAMYRRALTIREARLGKEHHEVAVALNNLASVQREQRNFNDAVANFRRALAIEEKVFGPTHTRVATRVNNLATVYQMAGRVEEAEEMYRRAISTNEQVFGMDYPEVGVGLGNLAKMYSDTGRYAEAEAKFERALRIALVSGKPGNTWVVWDNLSGHHKRTSPPNNALAIFYGKQAVNTLQGMRSQISATDKETQQAFLRRVTSVYRDLAELLIQEGRLAEAQQVLAMLKEQEFHEFIRGDAGSDPRTTTANYSGPELDWSRRYSEISARLAEIGEDSRRLRKKSNRTSEEEDRLAQIDADLKVAFAAFSSVMNGVGKASSDTRARELLRADIQAKSIDFQGALKDMGHQAVLAQYLVLPGKVRILLTTPNVSIAREALIDEKELNRQIAEFRQVLGSASQNPVPRARVMHDLLIKPIAEDLRQAGARTLMLSLDGVLRYLPFAALHDGKGYLAEKLAVAIYPEAAKEKRLTRADKQWKVWGLGLTEAKAGFNALPSVRHELESIVGNTGLPGDIRMNRDFTRSAVKEGVMKSYPVLHIASHFKFTPGSEADSFLLLGGNETECERRRDCDKLSLTDIRQGYDFGSVDLLTLSACETAVGGGQDAQGVEVEGLGVVAQTKGAKGILATLWPVADNSTALLMQTLYRQRGVNGHTKAEALRLAQLDLIRGNKQRGVGDSQMTRGARRANASAVAASFVPDTDAPYAHPYYWAPFILMGNWL